MNDNASPAGGPTDRRFPDFLCIGAQKAGTTWLYDNLRRHPQIWLPPVKELHYFNHLHIEDDRRWTSVHRSRAGEAALRRYQEKVPPEKWDHAFIARLTEIASGEPNDDWYARIFESAVPSALCGDITPRYASIPREGVRHVHGLIPDAKILYILRDPIERCWSHMRMLMKEKNIAPHDLPAIEKMARRPGVIDRADYSSAFESWSVYASEGRFLTLFFDDIAETPEALLRGVCTFLEIGYEDKFFPGVRKHVHAGRELEMPAQIHSLLKTLLRPVYEDVLQRFPTTAEKWMAAHYGT